MDDTSFDEVFALLGVLQLSLSTDLKRYPAGLSNVVREAEIALGLGPTESLEEFVKVGRARYAHLNELLDRASDVADAHPSKAIELLDQAMNDFPGPYFQSFLAERLAMLREESDLSAN